MYKFLISLIIIQFSCLAVHEKSDAFIIKANPRYFKILSPVKVKKNIGLIVQNKSLVKLVGKLVNDEDKIIELISIESGKSKAVEFRFNKAKKFYFVPISPPFQKIELKLGEKSYEVPSQR
jgi:hypothetical protein